MMYFPLPVCVRICVVVADSCVSVCGICIAPQSHHFEQLSVYYPSLRLSKGLESNFKTESSRGSQLLLFLFRHRKYIECASVYVCVSVYAAHSKQISLRISKVSYFESKQNTNILFKRYIGIIVSNEDRVLYFL